jgi:hypothetical protein
MAKDKKESKGKNPIGTIILVIKYVTIGIIAVYGFISISRYAAKQSGPGYSARKPIPSSQEITLTEEYSTTSVVCTEEWINTVRPNFHWPYTVHWVNYRINQQADTPMEAGQLFDCQKGETMTLRFKIEAGYKGPAPTVTVLHEAP